MVLTLLAALPFLGAALVALAGRLGRSAALVAACLAPAIGIALLAALWSTALQGAPLIETRPWLPDLGLGLAFRLDGLSLLFAVLVLGVGLLILLYSGAYFGADPALSRFLSMMLLFMGGMLGIVLAENLLLLVMFWEVTSLTSFLLIGFEARKADARASAIMALTVTGAGGLALLGAVILLGRIAGFDVAALGAAELAGDPLAEPILILVVLAAFAKSAQMPLHFWLPRAMVAPTPVSAYLHSAAMVKAGIYLLARLWPVLSGIELWTPLVAGIGMATMLVAAFLALRQDDLKALLAYSTISHLGLIVMLLGLGSRHAVTAALLHVVNHSVFKAALFMVAGGVDKAAGTRDLRQLSGLLRAMPTLGVVALVAAAAMAGLPPLGGYVSKELMLDAVVAAPVAASALPWIAGLATAAAALSAAYAYALVARGFLGRPSPQGLRRPGAGFVAPAAVLAATCIALGLAPQALTGPLLESATAAVTRQAGSDANLGLLHGLTPALALGLTALLAGLVLAALRQWLAAGALPDAAARFERGFTAAVTGIRRLVHAVHDRALHRYLAILVAAILLAGLSVGAPLLSRMDAAAALSRPAAPVAVLGWAILVLGALGTVARHRRRVSALVLASVAGLMVALGYAWLSAPDLALTQVAVEIVTTVLILLAIRLLPQSEPSSRWSPRRLRDAVLALGAGAAAGLAALFVMRRPAEDALAGTVIRTARELPGTNLVHLVLVDFRALDTLGEIAVLTIAGLGVVALVRGFVDARGGAPAQRQMIHPEKAWDLYPLQFTVVARLLLPLAHLIAVFLFLRGESQPGGGFVAGLVLAMAVLIQYMANGVARTERHILVGYATAAAGGVLIAAVSGLQALARGAPFLTHAHVTLHPPLLGELDLGTVLLFDLGVFLTVAGATLLTMVSIGRIETEAPSAPDEPQWTS